ncbi:MAG TPA: hypothetical protein VH834_20570 [Solirubrobacteraceae bacterium]
MKLLEAEPVAAPEVAPEPPRETPPEEALAPPASGHTCKTCGAAMEDGQDWCLSCGTAAPGSLGERPGWRAATTVIALALLLVLGAVGAGYAALKSDSNAKTTASAPAAAPPAAQVTPPATQAPTTQTPTASTPTTSSTPKSSTLPKIHSTKPSTTPGSAVTPVNPAPTTSTPTTSTPTGSTSTPTTSTPTNTEPQDTGPQPIELKTDAGTAYDPYGRAKATGKPERALDGDTSTSWYVDPIDPQSIGVGYAVDLGKLQGIREIKLQTTTPGFTMEVYATDEPELPPDILDTRWSHITNVSKVGVKEDGKENVVLGAGSTKYRNLLLWFTTPPTDGARLRLVELQLLG